MYRKNQFTVYKQLTGFMKQMIYHTEWRPTFQSNDPCEYCTIKNPAETVDHDYCVLSGPQLPQNSNRYTSYFPKMSNATPQKVYMLNKNKRGNPQLHNS